MRKLDLALSGRAFIFGMFFGFLLLGCAGVSFPYKYYKPILVSWEGTLLGDSPSNDLPASVCAPDDQTDGKCVIMKASDFFRLKTEHLDLQNRLNDCERP